MDRKMKIEGGSLRGTWVLLKTDHGQNATCANTETGELVTYDKLNTARALRLKIAKATNEVADALQAETPCTYGDHERDIIHDVLCQHFE